MTTIDATRQLALWIDSWDGAPNSTPPIGVPVPVKTQTPPTAQTPAGPPAPQPPKSSMTDMSVFEGLG